LTCFKFLPLLPVVFDMHWQCCHVSRCPICQSTVAVTAVVTRVHLQHLTLLEEVATPQGPCPTLLPPGQTSKRRCSLSVQPRPSWAIARTLYLQVTCQHVWFNSVMQATFLFSDKHFLFTLHVISLVCATCTVLKISDNYKTCICYIISNFLLTYQTFH
jgi:hypothetical protein